MTACMIVYGVGGRTLAAVQTANGMTRRNPKTATIKLAANQPQNAQNPRRNAAPGEKLTSTTSMGLDILVAPAGLTAAASKPRGGICPSLLIGLADCGGG